MQATMDQVCWVPVGDIVDAEEGAENGQTILLAARGDGRFTLLGGADKLRRLKEQGLGCVDAVISPTDRLDERVSRLLDRLVRGDIHYLDEAMEYRSLMSGGLSTQELAARLGRTAATVRRKLRLLNLGEEACALLREYGLREGYAQELLRVPGQQGRLRVLKHISEADLTVKETEKLVDDVLSRMPVPLVSGRRMKPLMRDYRLYLNAIRGIVEQMRDAGLDASITVTVGKRVAEARVTVPLFSSPKGND